MPCHSKLSASHRIVVAQVRVVSMPSTDLFDKQSTSYRRSVLIPGVPTISVEASA